MTFGQRLTLVRKERKLSQDQLAKSLETQGAVIGRYERDEVKPSIEMAVKIAQELEVSLDYLTGTTDLKLDKKALNRIQEIMNLQESEQETIYQVLDAYLRDAKTRIAYNR
jgi:transcriptional regulator with XRE-family HTH domain